jgi:hypothetical protein
MPSHPDYVLVSDTATLFTHAHHLLGVVIHLVDPKKQSGYNSYGSSFNVCAYMKQSELVHKCSIMTLETRLSRNSLSREYDIFEELYLGALPLGTIPFHHLAVFDIRIEDTNYSIAIETSLRHIHRVQVFVANSTTELISLLQLRYPFHRSTTTDL